MEIPSKPAALPWLRERITRSTSSVPIAKQPIIKIRRTDVKNIRVVISTIITDWIIVVISKNISNTLVVTFATDLRIINISAFCLNFVFPQFPKCIIAFVKITNQQIIVEPAFKLTWGITNCKFIFILCISRKIKTITRSGATYRFPEIMSQNTLLF